MSTSVIPRYQPPQKIREESEVAAAYKQVGKFPHNDTKNWYGSIYEYYQDNVC